MSFADLAARLERGDPDRFLALMAAPPAARARLLPLYAFNLEVARAAWVTDEPLIAEMRLQWWRDALAEIAAGGRPRAHEVLEPLAAVLRQAAVPPGLLDAIAAARRWDIGRDRFADAAALARHLEATGGNLMWAAALALGAPPAAEAPVRDLARAGALAAWLQAVPALRARGRHPLPDPAPQAVAALAREGLGWLSAARRERGRIPRQAVAALHPAWQAGPILRRAARDPAAVAEGRLGLSEAGRRGRLLWQALTGRW
ncbi:MAG: squalene/phytoene synthase family protein [Rhodobacteraceae bacterium]|nr:squalene/phytoene synthase family protein [Paracoccaceae bacterium]